MTGYLRNKRSDQTQEMRASGHTLVIWKFLSKRGDTVTIGQVKDGAGAVVGVLSEFRRRMAGAAAWGREFADAGGDPQSCFFCCGVSLCS